MPFTPRQFQEILADMIAYVRTNTNLTDFNKGSVIRTILEASALEDDEQYFQMLQILLDFSYRTAQGADLDKRAKDFNLTRRGANYATGNVIFMDTNLVRTYLTLSKPALTMVLDVENATPFASYTTPFTIHLGERASVAENVIVTSVNTTGNQLSLQFPGTLNAHKGLDDPALTGIADEYYLDEARVAFVSGAANTVINSGVVVYAPPVGENTQVDFLTTSGGTIYNAFFKSESIPVLAKEPGPNSIIGANRISQIASAPFSGASITNPLGTGGGTDAESDSQFADRISGVLMTLSKATKSAVLNTLLGVKDPVTGKQISRLSVYEHFVADPTWPGDGKFLVYIDDGTGSFTADVSQPGTGGMMFGVYAPGANSFDVYIDIDTIFPADGGWILLEDAVGGNEILEYATIAPDPMNPGFYLVTLAAGVVTQYGHTAALLTPIPVKLLDAIDESAGINQKFYQANAIAITTDITGNTPDFDLYVRHFNGLTYDVTTRVVYDPSVNTVPTSDYLLNPGTGQIEFINNAPAAGDGVFAYYTKYLGLVQRAQRTLDGDPRSPNDFPGIRALGVKGLVIPAQSTSLDVTVQLDILEGYSRLVLKEIASRIIYQYITSLNPGDTFIVNEIVQRIMEIDGIRDVTVSSPTSNQIFAEDTVPTPGTINVA